jgi:hypothetical protein
VLVPSRYCTVNVASGADCMIVAPVGGVWFLVIL